jgi:putative ABC transport system permease protein
MSLALRTLIYEFPRYLAAITALAMSGLMVLFFVGVFAGIIHSDLATSERSPADLIIMPAKVASLVNSNASLPSRVLPQIYLNPDVVAVASTESNNGKWINTPAKGAKRVNVWVNLWAVDTAPGSVTLPTDYSDDIRRTLQEPGAVAIDATTLDTLGVKLGDSASLNGHTVFVRAVLHNYGSADQPNVAGSRDTLYQVGLGPDAGSTGPLLVKIDDPARAEDVRDALNAASHGAFRAWTAPDFNAANEKAVMGQQIIGILLGFSVVLAILIGIGITSQTLRGAILSNIREFASLRALGISLGSLRLIVIELSAWVGLVGLMVAVGLTWLASKASAGVGLPLSLHPGQIAEVCALLMVIAIGSGAMAMGILKQSDPADLLR